MKRILIFAILQTVFLAGGAPGQMPHPGTTHQTPEVTFPQIAKRRFRFERVDYPYFIFIPSIATFGRSLPTVLLLHGGGGNGMEQISAWQEFAQHNEIILVAPTLPAGEAIEPKIPDLLHGLMEEAKQQVAIDPRRIYLFGHSAGGFFTFDAAMLDSKYYAAAAVHAAAIDPDYDWIMKRASRKIPIALYIGDSDPTCSFARSRRTRDNLLAQDFPLHYVEMPRHDHNYYAVSDQVNRDAWKFLSQYSLPK